MSENSLFKLFQSKGLEKNVEVKLYRHSNQEFDGMTGTLEEIYARDDLNALQSLQPNHCLGNGYLASFIAEERSILRFVGMWRIVEHCLWDEKKRPEQFSYYDDFATETVQVYELVPVPQFDGLIDRLRILWPIPRPSHRWLVGKKGGITDFEVHSILAAD